MAKLVLRNGVWTLKNDFLEIGFNTVDLTDGSWTLYDPESGINSVTFADGFNTVTWNSFPSSTDHNWSSTGDITSPRWYKLLKIENTQMTTGDQFALHTRLENDPSINQFYQAVIMGAAISPGSDPSLTILGTGGHFRKTTSGNPQYGAWTINASTNQSDVNNQYGKYVCYWGGDSAGGVTGINFDSSDDAIETAARASNQNTLTGNLTSSIYVMVGIGPGSNTTTINAAFQQKFKVGYVAVSEEP